MSKELKDAIRKYQLGTLSWDKSCDLLSRISKRKDNLRQCERYGPKSYNRRIINIAVTKFLTANPEYKTGSGSGNVVSEKLKKKSKDTSSLRDETKVLTSGSGSGEVITNLETKLKTEDSINPSDQKKEYPKDDIIARIRKRLADISNMRSKKQSEIDKIGTANDAKSIRERKALLDEIKTLGKEYDVLFSAKEKYFNHNIMPDESLVQWGRRTLTPIEALTMRNNTRSQISRLNKKIKYATGEELEELTAQIAVKTAECYTYQSIIDNAGLSK